MLGPTHQLGAAVAGIGVAAALGLSALEAGVMALSAVAVAKLPDQDRRLNPGPDHRSVTHSAVLAGGLALYLAFVLRGYLDGQYAGGGSAWGSYPGVAAIGLAAGYLSHLFLDSMTKDRIPLFLPSGPRIGLGTISTGSAGEKLFSALLVALGAGVLLATWGGGLGGLGLAAHLVVVGAGAGS